MGAPKRGSPQSSGIGSRISEPRTVGVRPVCHDSRPQRPVPWLRRCRRRARDCRILRGPRYQRLFPDVYAPAALEHDLALRARAAGVLVAGRGVIAGYAAAELLGASSGPRDALVDVLMPYGYRCAGLRVHRHRLRPDEAIRLGTTDLTAPVRAAFDLARWAPTLTERVAAVDALAYACKVAPD